MQFLTGGRRPLSEWRSHRNLERFGKRYPVTGYGTRWGAGYSGLEDRAYSPIVDPESASKAHTPPPALRRKSLTSGEATGGLTMYDRASILLDTSRAVLPSSWDTSVTVERWSTVVRTNGAPSVFYSRLQ